MNRGAIILCGGQSTRMGRDKNWLPFGPHETMLQRVVRLVGEAVPLDQIVCVAAPHQALPTLPHAVRIAYDATPQQGPLAGLATGLHVIRSNAHAMVAVACDTPLLVPALITRLFDLLGDHEISAPHDGHRWHPLPAIYRTSLLPQIESMLVGGNRSLTALLEVADTCRVAPQQFSDADANRDSLITCNTPADYELVIANHIIREPD